jgi:hypothetical protein
MHILRLILDDSARDPTRLGTERGRIAAASNYLQHAIDAYTEMHRKDFRKTIVEAFGPHITYGEITAMRSMLSLMLSAMPAG